MAGETGGSEDQTRKSSEVVKPAAGRVTFGTEVVIDPNALLSQRRGETGEERPQVAATHTEAVSPMRSTMRFGTEVVIDPAAVLAERRRQAEAATRTEPVLEEAAREETAVEEARVVEPEVVDEVAAPEPERIPGGDPADAGSVYSRYTTAITTEGITQKEVMAVVRDIQRETGFPAGHLERVRGDILRLPSDPRTALASLPRLVSRLDELTAAAARVRNPQARAALEHLVSTVRASLPDEAALRAALPASPEPVIAQPTTDRTETGDQRTDEESEAALRQAARLHVDTLIRFAQYQQTPDNNLRAALDRDIAEIARSTGIDEDDYRGLLDVLIQQQGGFSREDTVLDQLARYQGRGNTTATDFLFRNLEPIFADPIRRYRTQVGSLNTVEAVRNAYRLVWEGGRENEEFDPDDIVPMMHALRVAAPGLATLNRINAQEGLYPYRMHLQEAEEEIRQFEARPGRSEEVLAYLKEQLELARAKIEPEDEPRMTVDQAIALHRTVAENWDRPIENANDPQTAAVMEAIDQVATGLGISSNTYRELMDIDAAVRRDPQVLENGAQGILSRIYGLQESGNRNAAEFAMRIMEPTFGPIVNRYRERLGQLNSAAAIRTALSEYEEAEESLDKRMLMYALNISAPQLIEMHKRNSSPFQRRFLYGVGNFNQAIEEFETQGGSPEIVALLKEELHTLEQHVTESRETDRLQNLSADDLMAEFRAALTGNPDENPQVAQAQSRVTTELQRRVGEFPVQAMEELRVELRDVSSRVNDLSDNDIEMVSTNIESLLDMAREIPDEELRRLVEGRVTEELLGRFDAIMDARRAGRTSVEEPVAVSSAVDESHEEETGVSAGRSVPVRFTPRGAEDDLDVPTFPPRPASSSTTPPATTGTATTASDLDVPSFLRNAPPPLPPATSSPSDAGQQPPPEPVKSSGWRSWLRFGRK